MVFPRLMNYHTLHLAFFKTIKPLPTCNYLQNAFYSKAYCHLVFYYSSASPATTVNPKNPPAIRITKAIPLPLAPNYPTVLLLSYGDHCPLCEVHPQIPFFWYCPSLFNVLHLNAATVRKGCNSSRLSVYPCCKHIFIE